MSAERRRRGIFCRCLFQYTFGRGLWQSESEMTFKGAISEIFRNKAFLLVMGLFACVELSYDLIRISLPMTGAELNFSTEIIGTSLSAYYIVFTLFQIPVNNALKKIKRRSALMLLFIILSRFDKC